jgi:hypothetical protein
MTGRTDGWKASQKTTTTSFTIYNIKAQEKLWKFKYFTMQKYNLKKNPLKETKILQDIITQ